MADYSKKILIVDDDLDILEALQMIFEAEGYQTSITTESKKMFALIGSYTPDVVVLDMLLSGQDGRLLCQAVKNNQETQHVPIIMISAHPGAAQSTIAAGADDFVAKPFDIDDLLQKVAKHTEQASIH